MSGRHYVTRRDLIDVEASLSDRDRDVLQLVGHLKLVAGEHVRRLYFSDAGSGRHDGQLARRTLLRLTRAELLVRLERRVGGVKGGSDGFVYGLGGRGQRLVTFWRGEGLVRARQAPEPGSRFVQHRLDVTELYTRLHEAAREGEVEVVGFAAEPDCWRSYVGDAMERLILKPDAFVRLAIGERELWWFVEVDRGTVTQATRADQAAAYRAYWRSGAAKDVMPRVLWLGSDASIAERASKALRPEKEDGALFVVAPFADAVRLACGGSS